jgi:hypothetical protein
MSMYPSYTPTGKKETESRTLATKDIFAESDVMMRTRPRATLSWDPRKLSLIVRSRGSEFVL